MTTARAAQMTGWPVGQWMVRRRANCPYLIVLEKCLLPRFRNFAVTTGLSEMKSRIGSEVPWIQRC
jgi:hypothetical protein